MEYLIENKMIAEYLRELKLPSVREFLELKEQQARAAASGGGGGGTASGAGYYSWPVPSCTYITSKFGYRVHPIFGTTKYHSGVDIAAGYGATIQAAAGGTVSIAEKSDSYGYYCVIYHSNGTTT